MRSPAGGYVGAMTTERPGEPDPKRLDDLQDRIENARRSARAAEGADPDETRRFEEDGIHGPVDDAIAPPG